MTPIIIGEKNAQICLIQPVDEHDASFLEKEYALIRDFTDQTPFVLAAFQVDSWNRDLSPWEAPAVFGKEDFGDGADRTLRYIEEELLPAVRRDYFPDTDDICYIIGGYSLAGLFALWAIYQTGCFEGCAAASPSVWFPGFQDYATANSPHADNIYLSLGDREEKAKNPVMSTVGDCIRSLSAHYEKDRSLRHILEWNEGNHFKDADLRTAKAFAWCINAR